MPRAEQPSPEPRRDDDGEHVQKGDRGDQVEDDGGCLSDRRASVNRCNRRTSTGAGAAAPGRPRALRDTACVSEQDLETVRELNRAFNNREATWLDLYTADAEVHLPPGLPGRRVYAGLTGVAEAASLWTRAVEDYHWERHELIDADECVVGLFRFRSRINARTAWLSPPLGAVFYMQAGKIARVFTFFSWEEALDIGGEKAMRATHG
jgi:SnoaL-like domain